MSAKKTEVSRKFFCYGTNMGLTNRELLLNNIVAFFSNLIG